MKTSLDRYLTNLALVYIFKTPRFPRFVPKGVRVVRGDGELFPASLLTRLLDLFGFRSKAENPFPERNRLALAEYYLIAENESSKVAMDAALRKDGRLFEVTVAVRPGLQFLAGSGSVTMDALWALCAAFGFLAAAACLWRIV